MQSGGTALQRDYRLHRAVGLWLAAMSPLIALTGAMRNLKEPLFRPAMSALMAITPMPADRFARHDEARLTFGAAAAVAERHAGSHYETPRAIASVTTLSRACS